MIKVSRLSGGDPLVLDVVVGEAGGASRHRVTLTRADLVRLAGAGAPERLVEAAFRFLLEREPKESILARFDVSVIARYFPEFERELPRYLADGE
ncbi:MAG TPA: hypothetical protein VEF36_11080 [Roseiarcus sp.]|nr:hypothetical protein [Roseiarcus sp.]